MSTKVKSISMLIMIVSGLVAWLVFLNPFNLFVERSSRFSYEAFERVRPGMPVLELTNLLGRPIRVTSLGSDYWMCPNCSAFCFMGNPPHWLDFYREAWVYVGPDDKVRLKFLSTQP
jgi:hypothetical protein